MKENNISKGKKTLSQLGADEAWLKDQVLKYEFIPESDYHIYSNPNAANYVQLYAFRRPFFENAFYVKRKVLIGY
jgi:hypothetical protein